MINIKFKFLNNINKYKKQILFRFAFIYKYLICDEKLMIYLFNTNIHVFLKTKIDKKHYKYYLYLKQINFKNLHLALEDIDA